MGDIRERKAVLVCMHATSEVITRCFLGLSLKFVSLQALLCLLKPPKSQPPFPPILNPSAPSSLQRTIQKYNAETKKKDVIKSDNPDFMPTFKKRFPKLDTPLLVRVR